MKPNLLIGALVALAGPAFAQDACTRPEAPAIDSQAAAASVETLTAAKQQSVEFIKASDAFQDCVLNDAKAKKDEAKAKKVAFDPSIAQRAQREVSANQADKEKVGKAYNEAVKAYKAAHPS
jgi:Skp family chaperone for outer membrane proteins